MENMSRKNRIERQKIEKKTKNCSRNEAETTKSLNNHTHTHMNLPNVSEHFGYDVNAEWQKPLAVHTKFRISIEKNVFYFAQ